MKKSLLLWQFFGFAFVSVLGTLLHFAFDWLGQNVIVALFSAVNESVWEHIKLLVVSLVIFAVIESRYFKNLRQFWCAKLYGILTGIILIPVLYYTYKGAFGIKADWVNILIYYVTVAIVFWVETKKLKNSEGRCLSPTVSKIIIALISFLFLLFTFLTPRIPLFIDPIDSTYGYFKSI